MEDLKSQLERVLLEVLPKSMPVIEEPKLRPIGRNGEFYFECLVKVPYREDENDGGFRVEFSRALKAFSLDPEFITNSVALIASEVALCSCFARNGAQHVGV